MIRAVLVGMGGLAAAYQAFKNFCQYFNKSANNRRIHTVEYEAQIQAIEDTQPAAILKDPTDRIERTEYEAALQARTKAVMDWERQQAWDVTQTGIKVLVFAYTATSLASGQHWPGTAAGCLLTAGETVSDLYQYMRPK